MHTSKVMRAARSPRIGLFFARMIPALAICVLPMAAHAEEVTVRNDSFEPGQSVNLFADFNGGEQAAAWLTSPCTGDIVAVQIGWIQGDEFPPPKPTLQRAIFVYNNAVFPNPGSVLLELEAPVLTPPAINEFRYEDEGNTIPIMIPVTQGQRFVVSLEFDEPTNVLQGGAAVFADTNGCVNGRNSIFAGFWFDLCPLLANPGDIVIRAVVDCEEPEGACCDGFGGCDDGVQESDCGSPAQTFFVDQLCNAVTCPGSLGACCGSQGGCFDGLDQPFCENMVMGTFAGAGTECIDDVCEPGACCLPDGSCDEVVEAECTQLLDGTFEGVGSTCAQVNCPQPTGACCLKDLCVPNQTEANCNGFPEGSWQGAGTTCNPVNPCEPCAPGDVNCDGTVNLDDAAELANCLDGPSGVILEGCDGADLDGSGTVDLGDYALLMLNFGV